MFLAPLKTMILEALQLVYGTADAPGNFPTADFRGIWTGMEYPDEEANYPGIWVTFLPTASLQVAGIGHRDFTDPDTDGTVRPFTKWRFTGTLSFTCVAMTSLERDRLADSLVNLLAFGKEDNYLSQFHSYLDQNDLIAFQAQWDQLQLVAPDENQGTPWGTDDIVYEITVNMDCEGEFASEPTADGLRLLTRIDVTSYGPGETIPDSGVPVQPPPDTQWQ